MASKIVCRMAKVKKNDVKGYQIHNQRERESKTNPDINASLSHLNRDYINAQHISYMEKWKETFESQNESKRALRKDAVYFNEFVVGSDRDFFKDMDQSEKERFFKVSTDFFKERYGEQNVLYSVAHFDELKGAGAHAHIAIVPMKDGKLQSKNVFNRIELKAIQSLLPEHLQKHGFAIERGKEGSKAQHIETATYKMLKAQEAVLNAEQEKNAIKLEVDRLENKKNDLKELLNQIEKIENVEYQEETNFIGRKTGQIVVDSDDFITLKTMAERLEIAEAEQIEHLQTALSYEQENTKLKKEIDQYKNANEQVIADRVDSAMYVKTIFLESEFRDKRKGLERKIETIETENSMLQSTLEDTKIHRDFLIDEKKELVSQNAELKREVADWKLTAELYVKVYKKFTNLVTQWLGKHFPEAKEAYQKNIGKLHDLAIERVGKDADRKREELEGNSKIPETKQKQNDEIER
ncbi:MULTISPECIES: MobV family relaxase [unclassified Exiguobacterium]|uniref:MobV family relaxase n=1 Tax=unclassified Exiguobacterium TaxID=2644629 RepID=UPI001BED0A89|nr:MULTISPECIES: MobV family relaxase [unclassified Exiguobacterium]